MMFLTRSPAPTVCASPPFNKERIILEPPEVVRREDGGFSATLSAADSRAVHVRKVLNAEDGDHVRVGVVDAGW